MHLLEVLVGWLFLILNILLTLREGKGGRERGRETSTGCLSCVPRQESEPATQACALTGNGTCDLSLCGTMANQLSHSGQGPLTF